MQRAVYFDSQALLSSTGSEINALALTSGAAVYTEALDVSKSAGFATILVTESKSGGAGDVDISTEYSLDGTNFYPAYTTDMSGTITVEGNIVTALQNVTRWIAHTVREAPYMRYKLDPDADSEVTLKLVYVETS